MKKDCTHVFLHFRELARLVWNLGVWPNPVLRAGDCAELYDQAMARLFGAIVLLALDLPGHVNDIYRPGLSGNFIVEPRRPGVQLWVDRHPPDEPGRLWGRPIVPINPGEQRLTFLAFFDWNQLAQREFEFIEVTISQMDAHPEWVGHHGLVRVDCCSVWHE